MKEKPSKRKRGPGRPASPNPRAVLVALRLTQSEREAFQKAADKAGLTLTAYLLAPHRKLLKTEE